MKQALKSYKIVGLNNNLRFLKRVFDNPVFQQGDYDTSFIEQHIDTLLHRPDSVDIFDLITAVVARNLHHAARLNLPKGLVNYRNVKGLKDRQIVSLKDTAISKELHWNVEVDRTSESRGTVTVGDKVYHYEVQSAGKNQIALVVNGQIRHQEYFVESNTVHIFNSVGDKLGFRFQSDEMKALGEGEGSGGSVLRSPMPGTITKIYRKVGDVVKKGESVVAMEAMKMELVLKAEWDAKVVKLDVKEGEFVEASKVLVELERIEV
jgi:3-methylcrotonyl-CoA carboxylase alpha subunit